MKRRWVGALVVVFAALLPLAPVMLRGELPSFRDHEDYFVPLRAFTADALRGGELPLWNPYNASGEPWLANPQTGVFYPPAWIVAMLPFQAGYVAFLVLHLVVLGLGLRKLFMLWSSNASATLVSAALVVSGPVLSLLDVSNNLATFAWTPWILARALDRDRPPVLWDSVLLALSFLGGEPLLAIVTWIAWATIVIARRGRGALHLVAWRLFLAVALCAAQLMPFVAMLAGSDRAAGLSPEVAFRNSMSVLDWLAVLVSPAGVQPGIGGSQLFLPSIYVSPIVVLLGLAAFADGVERNVRRAWAAVLVASIFLASGSQFPLVGWLLEGLHLTVSRYPVKFALFGFVAVGVFCAIGFDHVHGLSTRARIWCAVAATGIVATAHGIHRSEYSPIATTGLVVGLLWLAGFLAILWFANRLDSGSKALLVGILLPVVVFESIAASRFLLESATWPYSEPYATVLNEQSCVMRLEQLDQVRTGPAHVRDRQAWMGGYLNLLSRQHDASTAAPVVDSRYQEMHDTALATPRMDLLDFLSVRYLLTERDLSSYGYPMIASYSGVAVFERPGAHPFLTAEFAPRAMADDELAYRELMNATTDSAPDRVLASELRGEYPGRAPDDAASKVHSISFDLRSVRADIEVSHPALVVLNQKNVEGWSVSVDGSSHPAVTSNALFRGVEVGEGHHEIVWSYRPRSLRAGIIVSLSAMLALAFEWLGVRRIQKKMSRSFHSEHA